MQFQNTTAQPITITVRLNAGTKITGIDGHGNKITREETPRLHTVHIPAEATVEIEDHIWEKAWETKNRVDVYTIDEQKCAGWVESDTSTQHMIKVPMRTGETITVYPIREYVKSKEIVIVKPVALKITEAEVLAALLEKGVDTKLEGQELIDLYRLIIG